jgi:hypothetical protein
MKIDAVDMDLRLQVHEINMSKAEITVSMQKVSSFLRKRREKGQTKLDGRLTCPLPAPIFLMLT